MARKYVQVLRKVQAEARKLLKAREAEQREQRRAARPAGRDRKTRRHEHREQLLPVDRKCPSCQMTKLSSRSWVVMYDSGNRPHAICLSCKRLGRLPEGLR